MVRRIRAIIILAFMWALGWSVLGALLGVAALYRTSSYAITDPRFWASPSWAVVVVFAISFAIAGAVNGAVFAIVLALAQRNGPVANLHLGKVTLWGVVGSQLIPGAVMMARFVNYRAQPWFFVTALGVIGVAGAISAAATLLLARDQRSSADAAA